MRLVAQSHGDRVRVGARQVRGRAPAAPDGDGRVIDGMRPPSSPEPAATTLSSGALLQWPWRSFSSSIGSTATQMEATLHEVDTPDEIH